MSDTRITVTLKGTEIILIGTAHVSRGSIDEVRQAIQEEKPDHICVELDEGRYAAISKKDTWEKLDMVKVFREGRGFLMMANLVLSGFQRRMGAELGVNPGEEMITALQTADELGIPRSLCDREISITLRRAWARCGLWSKSKLLASLLASAFTTEKMTPEEIENLKKNNELDSMMAELANYLPSVKETLIDERDHYLAAKIWAAVLVDSANSGQDGTTAPRRIIAVVGAGHLQGIKTHLEKMAGTEEDADVSGLNQLPPRSLLSQIGKFIIPAILVGLLAFGFVRAGVDIGLSNLLNYIVINGSLAAFGAILALGHPLAILVSFLGAPFTTFIPFIGIGLISGIIQAVFKKPRVEDAQKILDDTGSLKGIYRNRITHTLLVFFLSSIGSSIGTFVTIPVLAGTLFR